MDMRKCNIFRIHPLGTIDAYMTFLGNPYVVICNLYAEIFQFGHRGGEEGGDVYYCLQFAFQQVMQSYAAKFSISMETHSSRRRSVPTGGLAS